MKVWLLAKRENRNNYENIRFTNEARENNTAFDIVSPEMFDIIVTKEGDKSILFEGKQFTLPDCIIPRMGSGTTYFALAVIRHFERLGVFTLNSSQSIETAKDKLATLQILASNNIPIPKTILAKFPLNLTYIEKEFNYPIIVKTISGSQGKGVFLCNNSSQLEDLSGLMEVSKDSKVNVIIQEFISNSKGKDIRIIVLGGRTIGAMLRTAKEGKFKANFSAGGSVSAYEINSAVEWLSVESAKLIGLDIAGVDILIDQDGYKVCEVNSSPGFEGFEKALKINFSKEVLNYLHIRLEGII